MKRAKKKLVDTIAQKQKIVDSILQDRVSLLENLVEIHTKFNNLSESSIKTPEEWLGALPIQSLADFDKSARKNRLEIMQIRSSLRKTAEDTCKKIDKIDHELYMAKLDVLTEKINSALEK